MQPLRRLLHKYFEPKIDEFFCEHRELVEDPGNWSVDCEKTWNDEEKSIKFVFKGPEDSDKDVCAICKGSGSF